MIRRSLLIIALLAALAPVARAQQLDSPVGMSPALLKLFASVPSFTAKADVHMLDAGRKEIMRMPMDFLLLNNNLRLDLDANQIAGPTVRREAIAPYKKLGMDRMTSVIRPDQKAYFLIFPNCRSYLYIPFETNDVEAVQHGLSVNKTAVAKETIDGHACVKNNVVIKTAKGGVLLEAACWNAPDLKDFPVQIAMPSRQGTVVVHFTKVQLNRPAAAQFDAPKGFAKYHSDQALRIAIAGRNRPATIKK
jgi:hypothetical protein